METRTIKMAKAKRNIYATEYGKNVLTANSIFKKNVRSLNRGLKLLKTALQGEQGTKSTISTINKVLKDKEIYDLVNKNVRKTKKGTCPFYILQALHKYNQGRLGESKKTVAKAKKVTKKMAKVA